MMPDPQRELPPVDGLAAAILGTSEVVQFENLYVAHAAEARRIARAILGDSELAADAVHTGFLEMLRYLLGGRRWHDPSDARAMVLRNVRWAALSMVRSRRRLAIGVDAARNGDADDAAWARSEARALCTELVARLRPNHRAALHLRHVEGLSNIEAAARLGIPVKVFAARLQRATAAARREARSAGVGARWGVLVAWLLRGSRRHWSAGRRPALRAAVTLAAAGLGVAAVHGVDRAAVAAGSQVGPPARAPLAARLAADSIDDTQLFDAVVLPSGLVVVVGQGHHCGCVMVFQSGDGGATWEVGAGPSLPAGRHAVPCNRSQPSLPCQGHALDASAGDTPAGTGAVLDAGRGRLLYLQPLSGVLCSADQGRTWAPRCPGGAGQP